MWWLSYASNVYTRSSQIVVSPYALVRLDRLPIEDAARGDWRVSLALRAWQAAVQHDDAETFLANMRRVFAPDPAHLTDCTASDLQGYRIVNFSPHPFVMDGAEHTNTAIGEIREIPVRIAAEETYGLVAREGMPAAFMVSMPSRVYRRLMLPFFGYVDPLGSSRQQRVRLASARTVTRIVTLIHPILQRASLAEVIAGAAPPDPGALALAHS